MRNVSVIIPALNEERNIGKELDKLEAVNVNEIVIIDDGSSDNTVEIVRQAARQRKNIALLRHKVNKGKGASMKAGAKAAKNDVLVFVDADGQFDVSEIPKLVKALKDADMVVGSRNFKDVPAMRRVSNLVPKLALFLATGKRVKDALSGFRAIRKKDFLNLGLRKNRYEIESEMSYRALKKKMKVKYIPVTVNYDAYSQITPKQALLVVLFLIKATLRLA